MPKPPGTRPTTVTAGSSLSRILQELNWPILPPVSGSRMQFDESSLHPSANPNLAWGYVDRIRPWWLREEQQGRSSW